MLRVQEIEGSLLGENVHTHKNAHTQSLTCTQTHTETHIPDIECKVIFKMYVRSCKIILFICDKTLERLIQAIFPKKHFLFIRS